VGSCTIRREEYDVDEKRMPAAWMTSRRDEYDVDEKRMLAAWMTSRCDEYEVNEDGVRLPAAAARMTANMMRSEDQRAS